MARWNRTAPDAPTGANPSLNGPDTFTSPARWASALVNEDFSGLDENETAAVQVFIASIHPWSIVSNVEGSNETTAHHDASEITGGLIDECVEYTAHHADYLR